MKKLKLLNKKYLSIILIFLFHLGLMSTQAQEAARYLEHVEEKQTNKRNP